MKKSVNTPIYSNYSQEINPYFLAVTNTTFRFKSDFMALNTQITFLFQEKLLIIYANIRVWIIDLLCFHKLNLSIIYIPQWTLNITI